MASACVTQAWFVLYGRQEEMPNTPESRTVTEYARKAKSSKDAYFHLLQNSLRQRIK